jgi:LDH2 family malate/lactate/ureidoglycolate dehydrogenase
VLSGATFGMHVGQLYSDADVPQNLGHFFAAINIRQLNDLDTFKAGVDLMIDDIKSSRKAPDVEEIYVPGEIEFDNETYFLEKGIGVGPGVLRDLRELSARYGDGTDPVSLAMPV